MAAESDFFAKDAFSQHCGVEMISISPGAAEAKMQILPVHLNSMQTAHGAAIFALADAVFAAASNSHGYPAFAVNINISYIKAVREGTLYASARENNPNGRMGSYTVTISNAEGETVALFEGLAFRKFDK